MAIAWTGCNLLPLVVERHVDEERLKEGRLGDVELDEAAVLERVPTSKGNA